MNKSVSFFLICLLLSTQTVSSYHLYPQSDQLSLIKSFYQTVICGQVWLPTIPVRKYREDRHRRGASPTSFGHRFLHWSLGLFFKVWEYPQQFRSLTFFFSALTQPSVTFTPSGNETSSSGNETSSILIFWRNGIVTFLPLQLHFFQCKILKSIISDVNPINCKTFHSNPSILIGRERFDPAALH